MASTNRIAWLYTDDTGTQYRVAAQKLLTDQAVLGGAAALGTENQLPEGVKMRRASSRDPGGVSRSFPLYDGTQVFVQPVGSPQGVISANVGGTGVANFTDNGTVTPEKRPKRSGIHQTT